MSHLPWDSIRQDEYRPHFVFLSLCKEGNSDGVHLWSYPRCDFDAWLFLMVSRYSWFFREWLCSRPPRPGNISFWSLQLYEEWYLDTVCSYHQQLNGFIPDCSCTWRVIKILVFKESLKVIVDPVPSVGILLGHTPAKCCGSDEDQVEESESKVMLQRSSGQILTLHQDEVEGLYM